MSEVIFEAGDVVTCAFYGDEEFVLIDSNIRDYSLQINFLNNDGEEISNFFTRDGRYHSYHSAPVLKLVRKKTKKRNVIEFFKVNSENESFFLNNNEFDSYDDALDWIKGNGVNGWVYSIDKFYKIKDL